MQGDKVLMGGGGDIDLMGGPNFDRLYHIGYVLLKLVDLYLIAFKFVQ